MSMLSQPIQHQEGEDPGCPGMRYSSKTELCSVWSTGITLKTCLICRQHKTSNPFLEGETGDVQRCIAGEETWKRIMMMMNELDNNIKKKSYFIKFGGHYSVNKIKCFTIWYQINIKIYFRWWSLKHARAGSLNIEIAEPPNNSR